MIKECKEITQCCTFLFELIYSNIIDASRLINWKTVPDNFAIIILLLLTTKDVLKTVHRIMLLFRDIAITTSSMEIEMGFRLLPDLEPYINEIKYVPEFKKIDCCINGINCKTMHWDPDGNGSWNVKSNVPFIKTNPPSVFTVVPPPVQTKPSFWFWLKVL